MDGFIAGAGENVAGGLVLEAKRGFRAFRLAGRYEPTWIGLTGDQPNDFVLSAKQVADIEIFLDSPTVRPLLSLLAITHLSPPGDDRDQAISAVRGGFTRVAATWNVDSKSKWSKHIDAIWERVNKVMQSSFEHVDSSILSHDELLQFSRFLASPLELEGKASRTGDYLRRVRALASDINRLAKATETSTSLLAALRSKSPQPILTHTDADISTDFDSLYISRTIHSAADGSARNTEDLLTMGEPFRIVLTGSPGAGKTTFVTHLVNMMARGQNTPQITILIKCRDYVRDGWNISIPDYVLMRVRAEVDSDADIESIRDLLLLGRIVIVYDGLDEITEIPRRADMVTRIESMCRLYPATSVLVSSREVGYNRAPLSSRLFEHDRLLEFSVLQVNEYATRWFELMKRSELTESFISESQSIADLRKNPLLLSLLCILYKARGAIPVKRREIYAKCADLLFTRWDSHRGIPLSEEMPSYGPRVMQEIARWVYDSQKAQAGLEEQVIAKVIAVYLADAAGITTEEARRRAEEFLDFCAGRAWLLAKIGTGPGGEKIFGFTHRTFFEYFAAESFSRRSSTVDEIAERITEAFSRDSTSVLPELLIQAYDDKEEFGGRRVFEKLCSTEKPSCELAVRLMDGILMPARVRKVGFDLLCTQWEDARLFTIETFTSLLALNPDARHQFVNDYLAHPGRNEARRLFVHGWASIQLSRPDLPLASEWEVEVAELLDEVTSNPDDYSDAIVKNWLALMGIRPFAAIKVSEYLLATGRFGLELGAIWWLLERDASGGAALEPHQVNLLASCAEFLTEPESIEGPVIRRFAELADRRLTERLLNGSPVVWKSRSPAARSLLVGLGLAALETEFDAPELYWMISEAAGLDTDHFANVRRWSAKTGAKPDPQAGQHVLDSLHTLPAWCKKWCADQFDIVQAAFNRPPYFSRRPK